MKTVLVIAAHPDDEVLGCGGAIAKLTDKGHFVNTLILGEGVTSRDSTRDTVKRKEELLGLKQQAEDANRSLGVKRTTLLDFPDNRFDTVPLLDIVKSIETLKGEIDPDIVFTHYRGDLNIDHRIAFEATITAFRPGEGQAAKEIYSYEVASSTEWGVGNTFKPNVFMNISVYLKQKINAMRMYLGETRHFPHPRSEQGLKGIAERWGSVSGCRAAEAFELIRAIK